MTFYIIFALIACLVAVSASDEAAAGFPKNRLLEHRHVRGWKKRQLYDPTKSPKSHDHGDETGRIAGGGKGGGGLDVARSAGGKGGGGLDVARSAGGKGGGVFDVARSAGGKGGGGFDVARSAGGKGGGGHYHSGDDPARAAITGLYGVGDVPSSAGTDIYNAMDYTTATSALTTYGNKCDAANAGAEYKTNSYVPVYYQYEVVTNPNRNILQIADIIDKACQHFLAVWMVDCDTTAGGSNRGRELFESTSHIIHRSLQTTLAPIVGTGVGDYDTVLLGGSSTDQCTVLVPSSAIGQVCYKVIGSLLIYLDETMEVVPSDVQTLAIETLTFGMNYGTTDFTQLDPDIHALQFIQVYGSAPQDLINQNSEANLRAWDLSGSNNSPIAPYAQEAPVVETVGRSGGAKFGMAFASLLCISISAFLAVFMFKNRDQLLPQKKVRKQEKHYNLDDMTYASTNYDPKGKERPGPEEEDCGFDNSEVKLTVLRVVGSRSPVSESAVTRPVSPDPETPRHAPANRCVSLNESNIVTPRSDWDSRSNVSARSGTTEMTEPVSRSWTGATPDDRIRINLSKEAIRSSARKPTPRASQLVSPDRSYQIEDTVDL